MLKRLQSFIGPVRKHLGTALRDFRHVASIFPSTRFAIARIVAFVDPSAVAVVEYGAGTGNVTRGILQHLGKNARVIGVELNPSFSAHLKKDIQDPRFTVSQGSVLAVLPSVRALLPQGASAVVSGIPFSLIPSDEREEIVAQTRKLLNENGRFIVYQNSRLMMPVLRRHFAKVECHLELRNIFPYFIMVAHAK